MSDGHRFVIPRDGIFDWLQRDSKILAQPCRAFEPIDLHVERNELRLEQSRERCRQNFERKTARLAGADGQERFSLFRGGFLVHEEADRAVAFMNCFWPRGGEGETEAIERELIVLSALDFPNTDAVTKAGRRRRGKFARTSVIAVARLKIVGIKRPFFHLWFSLFGSLSLTTFVAGWPLQVKPASLESSSIDSAHFFTPSYLTQDYRNAARALEESRQQSLFETRR